MRQKIVERKEKEENYLKEFTKFIKKKLKIKRK